MKDPNIRQLLKRTELSKYLNDPHSKIVEELKLPVANARIDMAVINGYFHGYEIKSACDTLQRLPNQLIGYSYVFDYLTVITEKKYFERILNIIPEWVGLMVCSDKKGEKEIEIIQQHSINLNKKGFFLAKLLWNEELIQVLTDLNIPFRKKYRNWILCEILSENVEIERLSFIVREKLKHRGTWKAKEGYSSM